MPGGSRAVWNAALEANSWFTGPIFMRYRKNESIFEVDYKYAYQDNIWNSHMRNIQQIKLKLIYWILWTQNIFFSEISYNVSQGSNISP